MLTKDNISWTKSASYIFVENDDATDDSDDITIDRAAFEAYVDRNDLREYSHEDTGKTMVMPFYDYYDSPATKYDILSYINVIKACDKVSSLIHDILKP